MPVPNNYKKYTSNNPIRKFLLNIFISNILKIVSNLAQKENISYILDAGCGEGFIACEIRKQMPSINIVGIDISEQSLQLAKKLNSNVNFIKADITKIPYDRNAFDLVLALEVLEHLSDPQLALEELKRVTKKYCLISVPWEPFFSLGNFFSGRYVKYLGHNPEHLNLWKRKEIINLVSRYFEIEFTKTSFPWLIILSTKKE